MSLRVRAFGRDDVPAVLALMRELAVFEGYIDQFRVTEADLVEYGLGPSPRFGVLVAEQEGAVLGIAVHYLIPWTYDLRPTLVLKELFVAPEARGTGTGQALFTALRELGQQMGAARLSWTVLPTNDAAKHFYRKLGGAPDTAWEPWTMQPDQLSD